METTEVKGIVISSMPIGEYDRRLEILTDELGRISVFARGSRKPSSPLVACSRTFAFGTFSLYQGRSAYNLHGAAIQDFFTDLSEDFEKSCYGSYFLELAKYFSQEGLEAQGILQLIYHALKALSSGKMSDRLIRAVYELKMVVINGLYREPDKAGLTDACVYALDFVMATAPAGLFSFRLAQEAEQEFVRIAERQITRVADRKFKSLEMLKDL